MQRANLWKPCFRFSQRLQRHRRRPARPSRCRPTRCSWWEWRPRFQHQTWWEIVDERTTYYLFNLYKNNDAIAFRQSAISGQLGVELYDYNHVNLPHFSITCPFILCTFLEVFCKLLSVQLLQRFHSRMYIFTIFSCSTFYLWRVARYWTNSIASWSMLSSVALAQCVVNCDRH